MCRKPMVPGFFRTTREELRVIVSFFGNGQFTYYSIYRSSTQVWKVFQWVPGISRKSGLMHCKLKNDFLFCPIFGIYILANMKKRSVSLDFETPVLHGISKVRNPGRHWYLFYNLYGTECYYQCSLFSILDHQSYCRMLHILAQGL